MRGVRGERGEGEVIKGERVRIERKRSERGEEREDVCVYLEYGLGGSAERGEE